VAGVSPLCIACHREEALVAGTDHDLRITAPESVNGPGKGPAESGLCGACHGVHNIRSAYLLWNRPVGPALDAATSLCTGCHRDQGTGRRPPRAGAHLATGEEPGELQNRREFITRKGSGGSGASLRVFSDAGTEVGRGYVTCLTCHGAHRWDADLERPGPGEPQDGDAGNSFLRVKGSFAIQNSFCNDCHRYDVVEKFRAFHQPRK
jgi:predicted CXXCH cytochrome family protein